MGINMVIRLRKSFAMLVVSALAFIGFRRCLGN